MNMKNTIKKIVALGAGAGLVGATLVGALADLSDYPSQFIDDGEFDGKIVVGADAASQDIIGAIDIAASLQAASVSDVEVGSGSTVVDLDGDVKKVADAGDILEINEQLGDVVNTLTEEDLEMLFEGEVETDEGSTDFTQTIELDPTTLNNPTGMKVVWDVNDDTDELGYFLYFEEDEMLFEYQLDFTSGLESDLSGTSVEDFDDEVIVLMGKEYSIVDATLTSTGDLVLELISGDQTDALDEGETQTYRVDGVDYEVTVLIVGQSGNNDQVKFLVNGEVTDSLAEGETEELTDGTEIGVREIIVSKRNFEGDQGSVVEFYLGANKVTLTSDGTDTTGTDGSVEFGDEDIEEADLVFDFTNTSTSLTLNQITYGLELDSTDSSGAWVAPGEGLRSQIDEPEGMLNTEWDIWFAGMSEPDMAEIRFDAQGDDEYEFVFTNQRGTEYSVPYLSVNGANVKFGEEGTSGDDLIFWERFKDTAANVTSAETFPIGEDDYFVLTDNPTSGFDEDADSYVYQFVDIDTDDSTITFRDAATGNEREEQYSGALLTAASTDLGTAHGDITVGGTNYDFWIRTNGVTPAVYTLAVDMNGDGDIFNSTVDTDDGVANDNVKIIEVVTQYGGVVELSADGSIITTPAASNVAQLTTVSDDMDEDDAQTINVTFTVGGSGEYGSVGIVAADSTTYFNLEDDEDNDDRSVGVTQYGTWVERVGDSNEADEVIVMYPSSQVEALVYVVGGETTSSTRRTGGTGAQRVNKLPVGLAVLDTEVDVGDDNLIVVGGPCANSVAAELLGNPADCTEGFEPDMAMIRMWETDGNTVAVLVAGYSAADTVAASRVLARATTEDVDEFDGDAVEIVIAGSNNVDIRAASMDMDMDMDAEADMETQQ